MGNSIDRLAKDQRLRMQRFYMSAALYAMWGTMTVAASLLGMIDTATVHLWTIGIGVFLTATVLWGIFKSGFNLRFKDSSLTFFQCAVGLSWLMVFMLFVPEWRDLLISVFLTGLMFGIFQLSAREFSALALFAFAGFSAVSGYNLLGGKVPMDPANLVFRVAVVGFLLIWCAYFANHVSALRARLKHRNDSLQQLLSEVTTLAERDHLTQAYNRRSIIDSLGRLRNAALRYGNGFSIIILDIDFFKQVNDRFGHLTGDEILAAVADRMRSELRMLDELTPLEEARMLGRYGGEEFIIILPHTDLDGAEQCAERIRHSTASHRFHKDMSISLSAGVATYGGQESIDGLLRRADEALYMAKENGRNCVYAIEIDHSEITGSSDVVNLADYQQEH